MPSGTIYVSKALTDFVVKYSNKAYVGTQALPPVKVSKKQGTYYIFDKTNAFALEETVRPHLSVAGMSDLASSTATYSCEDHAWREFMADSSYDQADPPVKAQMNKAEFVTNILLLAQENRIKTLLEASGSYSTTAMTLTSDGSSDGYQFDQYTAGGTSIFDIFETAKAACFQPPNSEAVLLVNQETFRVMKHHPAILNRIVGGATTEMPAAVLKQTLAEILEFDEILVGEAKYNSTDQQATGTYSYLWGRHAVVLYRAKSPSIDAAGLGYTFLYNPGPETAGQVPGVKGSWRVRTYRNEEIGGGGRFVEVENYPDEKIVCGDAGILIQNAIGSVTPT